MSALPSDSCDKHAMVTSMCIFPVPQKNWKDYTKYSDRSMLQQQKNTHVSFLRYLPVFFKKCSPPPKKKTETSLQPTASQRTVERSHLHLEGVTFHEGIGPSPGSEAKFGWTILGDLDSFIFWHGRLKKTSFFENELRCHENENF